MRKELMLSVAIAVALSTPAVANGHKASLQASDHQTIHYRTNFAKATALAPPVMVMSKPRLPETDGLSRNDEDCNYGCIDH